MDTMTIIRYYPVYKTRRSNRVMPNVAAPWCAHINSEFYPSVDTVQAILNRQADLITSYEKICRSGIYLARFNAIPETIYKDDWSKALCNIFSFVLSTSNDLNLKHFGSHQFRVTSPKNSDKMGVLYAYDLLEGDFEKWEKRASAGNLRRWLFDKHYGGPIDMCYKSIINGGDTIASRQEVDIWWLAETRGKGHYVYNLSDPRDGRVFYVGYSATPNKRYNNHITAPANKSLELEIDDLWQCGLRPVMNILHKFSNKHDALDMEQEEIRRISRTCYLANVADNPNR